MTNTMRAIVLAGPGEPDTLIPSDVPVPQVKPGWVRIRVKAFGVNESEVTSRHGGSSSDFSFPRILGIEAVGIIDAADPETGFSPGQKVATMMGGMGRSFDGSYAEYTVVPADQVIPLESELPWETLGALPEMFQTAYGSLTTGLDVQAGQTVLIRGGTSTVGLAAADLAADMGATVIATTRDPARFTLLSDHGVTHPLLDQRDLATAVRQLVPAGVDAALELVGTTTLPDTLRSVRRGGTGCFTGALSGAWTIENFSPFAVIPKGVRLTTYGGDASDLPADAFAHQLDAIAAGRIHPAIAAVYNGLEQVADAHIALESGSTPGKHVVVL
ncbi:alcohol dehydrogenase catalytic domain-containing protein [Leifsonia sp. A12D58]|uniref:alcohol dehydrogenase catalytic domain-containing protein n=1 Tax=Leifsonia sp. A12D58 TaxID=3397674 RepID=UPI0039E1731B